jgi:hypothetical protein
MSLPGRAAIAGPAEPCRRALVTYFPHNPGITLAITGPWHTYLG